MIQSIHSNQTLLAGFLASAQHLSDQKRRNLEIALKLGEHYEKWGLPTLSDTSSSRKSGKSSSLPRYQGSHELDKSLYPGYVHRLTIGSTGGLKEVNSKHGALVALAHILGKREHEQPQQSNLPLLDMVYSTTEQNEGGDDVLVLAMLRTVTVVCPPLGKLRSEVEIWAELTGHGSQNYPKADQCAGNEPIVGRPTSRYTNMQPDFI